MIKITFLSRDLEDSAKDPVLEFGLIEEPLGLCKI
jgi:hypothetical protein